MTMSQAMNGSGYQEERPGNYFVSPQLNEMRYSSVSFEPSILTPRLEQGFTTRDEDEHRGDDPRPVGAREMV